MAGFIFHILYQWLGLYWRYRLIINQELGEMWNSVVSYFKGLTLNLENMFFMFEYNPAYLHISVTE
jgi:hypothetical protein